MVIIPKIPCQGLDLASEMLHHATPLRLLLLLLLLVLLAFFARPGSKLTGLWPWTLGV